MTREFTQEYWESTWENISLPQETRPQDIPEIHQIFCSILPTKRLSLIEIGCAPGKWMVYFAKQFNYLVSGLDYAPRACEKTRRNLEHFSISAQVQNVDIFEFESNPFDIVFSAGFIEHFKPVELVMDRIIALCNPHGGLVITIIPSLTGLNRWISKTFRPHVAAGHVSISKAQLISLHQAYGLRTLYADYIESLHILPPIQKNRFAENYPRTSFVLNLPFKLWNTSVQSTTRLLGRYPKCGWITGGVLYIGQR